MIQFAPLRRGVLRSKMAARVKDTGLEVSCLSNSAEVSAPDESFRAKQLDTMRRYADLCQAFGCRQVRVFGGSIDGIDNLIANAVETLR